MMRFIVQPMLYNRVSNFTRPQISMYLRTRNWIIILLVFALSGCASSETQEPEATADELYAIARQSMERKNWLTAVDALRAVEAQYPYGVHAEQAQLDTIYAYYRNGGTGLAIAAADRFIKLHPTHEAVDYAYYLKGLANYQENHSLFGRLTGRDDLSDRDANITRDALNAFNDVHTLFPNSRYATDARVRAHHLRNALARHELVVASYYFSRKAYVAVVNRAKRVVEEYHSTPSVEDALALLVFSYQQMQLDDLSAGARRVLALNFPNSTYLGEQGQKALETNLGSTETIDDSEEKFNFFLSPWTRLRSPSGS